MTAGVGTVWAGINGGGRFSVQPLALYDSASHGSQRDMAFFYEVLGELGMKISLQLSCNVLAGRASGGMTRAHLHGRAGWSM
jgi:hypothetical protein